MTKYLFDSGILSAYIDRRHGVFEKACAKTAEGHRLGTCVPVVAEMAAGLERSSTRDRNLKALRLARDAELAAAPKPSTPAKKTIARKKKANSGSLSEWLATEAKEGRRG